MVKGSKILYWAGAGAALLLILLIAAAFITPRIVDSDWLKGIIKSGVADQIDGDFDFQRAELIILPSPAVLLHQVNLAIPDTVKAKLDSLKVYPKLIPLLTGNIELNKIVIDKPDYSMPLPQRKDEEPEDEEEFSLNVFLKATSEELTPVVSAVAGLEVVIRNGTLRLLDGDKEVYLFDNINTEVNVTTDSLTISMSSGANIWQNVNLKIKIIPSSQKAKGRIVFDRLSNKKLVRYFLADRTPLLGDSFVNLQLDFSASPDEGLSAKIKSSNSTLAVLGKENDQVIAEIANLEGSIHYTDERSTFTVEDLVLSYPKLQLQGTFSVDSTLPHAELDLKITNANIQSLNEVLPVFIRAYYREMPVVKEIFNITRGGTIIEAGFRVEGKSPADLGVFEAMRIQGHMKDGHIVLTDLGLDLKSVVGEISITNGILEGKNLQAQLRNTTGSDGILKLGLIQKETTPFHLDLNLNADLADVIPVLKVMLLGDNIQDHLSLYESLEGAAQGRLTLGETLESLKVRVQVDKIDAQAQYKLIPYPISVDGGSLLVEGLKIQSHKLQGKIGSSTFTNYSDLMNWEGEPNVDIQSGTFQLVMDEIFPWLTSNKKLAEELKNIENISGLAEIKITKFKGPLLKPGKIEYDLQGNLKNITLTATTLPGPLNIKSGQANIIPDKISFENFHAGLLDSSLIYSGVLQNFISGTLKAEVIVTNATIGHEVNTWLAKEIDAPREYQFRTPLLISRANAKWIRDELLDLHGDFSIQKGPIFSIDIMLNPDELLLRNLSIKNGDDHAFIKLELKKRNIGAEFKGSLSKKTIDKILLYRDVDHDAWIKGDIRFYIDMDSLTESTVSGNLDGGDFIIPLELEESLWLEGFSLLASDKTLKLNSAKALFQNKKYALNGQASLAQDRLSLDLDVRTDTIELDNILGALKEEDNEEVEEEKRVGKEWDLTFDTTINIHADSLLYNGNTWKPFESKITFANSYLGIEVLQAELCNISTPGKISFHEGRLSLDFRMEATDQELSEILICLEGGEQKMTGTMNLKANISGYGTKDTLVNSLQGNLQLSTENGRIYQDARAAKLLYFLNVTNMFQGKIPDLRSTGFYYDYVIIKGTMEHGILVIAPAKLEAPIMEIVSHGTIDIPKEKVYLQVLVAPLQTLNKIQRILPIIRRLIPSSLVAVPVEVSGDFDDIQVEALSMSAISSRVFGVMVDALSTPVRTLEENP
ncbi:MAG: AsmA-like C-terminal domain-containing protein [Deltaproteobacteria bacterium]|nr:MAG: AsmA-like C-terminal domain-containing protein [Deltaproteobacteria bacterium]